jgi:hypothetical protein
VHGFIGTWAGGYIIEGHVVEGSMVPLSNQPVVKVSGAGDLNQFSGKWTPCYCVFSRGRGKGVAFFPTRAEFYGFFEVALANVTFSK